MASAGRVLLISKGAWVSGTSYDPMDFVYYGGNSYVCKASVSGSTTPDSDTTHWQLMASGFDFDLVTQTITNDADKIASDAAVYTETQKLESNFAVIQASNVATQAFAIGDYLTYQGELYKVTSAIANGGTVTPGTNCTKTDVGTQLDALNDSLNGLIEIETYEGTTDASGLAVIGVSAATYTVLSAHCSGASYLCIPFVASSNNTYRVLVMDLSQNPKASTNVTIKYARIKKA